MKKCNTSLLTAFSVPLIKDRCAAVEKIVLMGFLIKRHVNIPLPVHPLLTFTSPGIPFLFQAIHRGIEDLRQESGLNNALADIPNDIEKSDAPWTVLYTGVAGYTIPGCLVDCHPSSSLQSKMPHHQSRTVIEDITIGANCCTGSTMHTGCESVTNFRCNCPIINHRRLPGFFLYRGKENCQWSIEEMGPFTERYFDNKHGYGYGKMYNIHRIRSHWPTGKTQKMHHNARECCQKQEDKKKPIRGVGVPVKQFLFFHPAVHHFNGHIE